MEPVDIKSVRDIGMGAGSFSRSSALVRKIGWFVYRPYVLTLFQKVSELRHELEGLKSRIGLAAPNQDYMGAIHDVRTSAETIGLQVRELGSRLDALSELQADFNALTREHIHGQKAVRIDLHAVQNRLLQIEEDASVADRISRLEQSLGEVAGDVTSRIARIAEQGAEDAAKRQAAAEEEAAHRTLMAEANENRLRQIEHLQGQLTSGLNEVLARPATSATVPSVQEPAAPAPAGIEVPNTEFYIYEGPYGRFMLRRHDLVSDFISRGEFWDPHLEPVIRKAAARGGTAIDAGAYFGFISVQLAKAFPRVISFEPQREIFQNLNTNLMLNGCHNASTYNMGLYSKPGALSLAGPGLQDIEIPRTNGDVDYASCPNAAAVAFEFAETAVQGTVPGIAATTIDSLGLDDVTFIKIDCQGADYHVLLGASETIRRCKPVIVFESEHYLEQERSIAREDYERLLTDLGYAMTVISDKGDGKQVDFLAEPVA